MNNLAQIKHKWLNIAPDEWWGDSIDVRFYLISQLKKLRKRCILDIGCNIGLMLDELDSSNLKHGCDIDREILRKGIHFYPDVFFTASSLFEGFPYRDNSFDAVIMANVMPYHEIWAEGLDKETQKQRLFQEVYRILKPGGRLFLTTPNGEHLCYLQTRRIDLTELQHTLSLFKDVTIYGWNPLPSFVFFLNRSQQRRIPASYHKYVCMPSPVLSKIPGIMKFLEYLMKKKWGIRNAKSFYVECQK